MTRSGERCEPFAVVNRDLRHRITAPTKRFALHRHIGTCGEGPANYPEITGFLEAGASPRRWR